MSPTIIHHGKTKNTQKRSAMLTLDKNPYTKGVVPSREDSPRAHKRSLPCLSIRCPRSSLHHSCSALHVISSLRFQQSETTIADWVPKAPVNSNWSQCWWRCKDSPDCTYYCSQKPRDKTPWAKLQKNFDILAGLKLKILLFLCFAILLLCLPFPLLFHLTTEQWHSSKLSVGYSIRLMNYHKISTTTATQNRPRSNRETIYSKIQRRKAWPQEIPLQPNHWSLLFLVLPK